MSSETANSRQEVWPPQVFTSTTGWAVGVLSLAYFLLASWRGLGAWMQLAFFTLVSIHWFLVLAWMFVAPEHYARRAQILISQASREQTSRTSAARGFASGSVYLAACTRGELQLLWVALAIFQFAGAGLSLLTSPVPLPDSRPESAQQRLERWLRTMHWWRVLQVVLFATWLYCWRGLAI